MAEKHCYKCDTTKPSSEFSKDKTKKGGLHNQCKPCANEAHRARRARQRAEAVPCATEGCDKIARTSGMCNGCYQRDRYGDCAEADCRRPADGKDGLCSFHRDYGTCKHPDGCSKRGFARVDGVMLCPMHHSHATGRRRPAEEVTRGRVNPYTVARREEGAYVTGSLYAVRLKDSNGETFIKIGLTERPVKQRLDAYGDMLDEILHVETLALFDVARIESWLHAFKARSNGFNYEPEVRFGGYRECYVDRPATMRAFHTALAVCRRAPDEDRQAATMEVLAMRYDSDYLNDVLNSIDKWFGGVA